MVIARWTLILMSCNVMLQMVKGCQVCSPGSFLLRQDHRGKHAFFGVTMTKGILMKQKTLVTVTALGVVLVRVASHRSRNNPMRHRYDTNDSEQVPSVPEKDKTNESKTKTKKDATSTAMISVLGVYKNFISPLLPPACRFVPTCSQYGVQAIERFGPNKGVVLIAWRLVRCSPFGGKGYDPPQWPPVSFTYSSY